MVNSRSEAKAWDINMNKLGENISIIIKIVYKVKLLWKPRLSRAENFAYFACGEKSKSVRHVRKCKS